MMETHLIMTRALSPKSLVFLLSVLLAVIFAAASNARAAEKEAGIYAVNLALYSAPVDPSALPAHKLFETHLLYQLQLKEGGKKVYRLRLGFFETREEAEKAVAALKHNFRYAKSVEVTKNEKKSAKRLIVKLPAEKAGAGAGAEDRLGRMMEEAETALRKGDYAVAKELYIKVLRAPESKYHPDAQELLGLARERNNELEQAKAEYNAYLVLYPKGEGADRVRQRLEALRTATAMPAEKLKKPRQEASRTEVYGSFSQFYNRDESFSQDGTSTVGRSTLTNDIDINIRKRGEKYDIRSAFTGGYEFDFLDSKDSRTRLSQLYLDISNKDKKVSGRVGRQTQSTGGVLGRFDGGIFSFQALGKARVNIVGGIPVDSSVIDTYNTHRHFYGINLDIGTFAERWDFNAFIINQMADGVVDRRAVGAEARYFHPDRSFFGLLDYDISYNELNTAFLVGNLNIDKTSVNLSADYRKSPALTTTNALQGQGVGTISELLDLYSESEVRQLARDRTSTTKSFTLGVTRPVNTKFQVSGDFTLSETSGTPASGGVEASEGTGNEYFYSAQLIGSNLIKEGDIAIFGLRYSDASSADTVSFNVNTRYPINHAWRINPRFSAHYSMRDASGDQLRIIPVLRTEYYWRRFLSLEFEGGMEWVYEWLADQTDITKNFFMTVGYRMEF